MIVGAIMAMGTLAGWAQGIRTMYKLLDPMCELREYVTDWHKKPWAWKQGWLYYERDPWNDDFPTPHEEGTDRHAQFEEGWNRAVFSAKVEGGYFDDGY